MDDRSEKIRELSTRIRDANHTAYKAIQEANKVRDAVLAVVNQTVVDAITEAGQESIGLEQLYA